MKKASILSAIFPAATLLAISSPLCSQVIFQDGYSTQSGGNNLPINTDIGITRQTVGTTSTFTHSGANTSAQISTNDEGASNSGSSSGDSFGRIRSNQQAGTGVNGFLSLDTNFGPSLAGQSYSISFDILYLKRTTTTTDQWISFALSDTAAPQGPNAPASDFGMLLRPNGVNSANNNLARFYEDGSVSPADDFATTPDYTSSYVNFVISIDETGSTPLLSVSADGTQMLSNFEIDFTSTDRYFSLGHHLGSGANAAFADVFFDDLTVTAVPEPTAVGLMVGGMLALVGLQRRRRNG